MAGCQLPWPRHLGAPLVAVVHCIRFSLVQSRTLCFDASWGWEVPGGSGLKPKKDKVVCCEVASRRGSRSGLGGS